MWQPDERLLVVGDALSDYDVGWVNLALDGPDAAATALASLHRLSDLAPWVLLPAHGPIRTETGVALATAVRRAQRLVDDPAGVVWYGARRIFAFALMIRDGIPVDEVEPYLHARAWLTDAAQLLGTTPEVFAAELIDTMLRNGAVILRGDGCTPPPNTRRCAAESPAGAAPRAWPSGDRRRES